MNEQQLLDELGRDDDELEEAGAGDQDAVDQAVDSLVDPSHVNVLLHVLKSGPRDTGALKLYAKRHGIDPSRVDRIMAHLVSSGRAEAFQHETRGHCYRLPIAGARPPAPEAPPKLPEFKPVKKEKPMAAVANGKNEWVSTDEAMKLMKLGRSTLCKLGAEGKIKSRKTGDGLRAPREFLRSSLVAYQPDFMTEPEAEDKPAKKPRKAKAKAAPRAKAPKAAAASTDSAELAQWIVKGYKLGRISAEEALEQLVELVG